MFNKLIKVSFFSFSCLYALNCSSVSDVKEYNGHYYTVTVDKLSFAEAKQFAEANGGYLAIPNTPEENSFLKSLIPTPKYAWIGVYDPQYTTNYCYSDNGCVFDDSRFTDIKGNALTYTDWAEEQPDNLVKQYDVMNGKPMVSPLGEHWVAMSSIDGKWADFGNHYDEYNNPVKFFALIEFDTMPECYTPTSDTNDEYSKSFCNTQIYDNTTGIVTPGQTYDCLQDPNGKYYCPAALAPCGEEWEYEDGYSVAHTSSYTATSDKEDKCPDGTILKDGKCYLDKNKDGKIDNTDERLLSVDYWTFTQHQDGKFYRATSEHLNYPVKMSISWGGDDWHFGAKIKNSGKLVWSRVVFPTSWTVNYLPDGSAGIRGVNWEKYWVGGDHDGWQYSGIGTGDFTVTNPGKMTRQTNWKTENNLANVTGDYFSVFFRDGGHSVANDYIKINFITHNIQAPFSAAKPVNPVYCPKGYTDDGTHLCYTQPSVVCPDGYTDNGTGCIKDVTYTYYQYLCSGTDSYGEAYEPVDEGGDCNATSENDLIDTNGDGVPDSCNSPTPPEDNCKAKTFVCKADPDRQCVYVDNQWQCSPYPCMGEGAGDYNITTDDTPTGIDDKNNDGWDSSGKCEGKIYIFNGKDYRCRSDDAFFELTGGGCCNKDKVFLGLVQCNEEEKNLAKMNKDNRCYYVGEYCSKKVNLTVKKVCVQHKKTYCCFNSKLAEMIQEQGRKQLNISWGTAKYPVCRGFTPEEFQKLDFSKMDLSGFYQDINTNVSQSVTDSVTTYIKNSVNSQISTVAK